MSAPLQIIGHYRITSKLGAGGMGEVWRATDTRLNREVAIKVLPAAFAADPMRMGRFAREAQVLASLNHPGIATIHGVEENALVMELVEGPTLAERIAQGKMALDEALPIATQIAEALEYAHEKGVIHRDLKPANIKITPEGRVKILDFGLAKAMSADASAAESAEAPTLSSPATLAGTILGTAAYMAPEQAKGKVVDRRADIWAVGAVLYEMLTGERAFPGEDVSDTLAAVLRAEPDLGALPAQMRPIVAGCLRKDARLRWRDIGDVRLALAGALPMQTRSVSDVPAPNRWHQRAIWGGVVVAVAVLAGVAAWWLKPAPAPAVIRFNEPLPAGLSFRLSGRHVLAISPDGSKIVYSAGDHLYLRALDALNAQIIPGTAPDLYEPVFSPDGQWIAYFVPGQPPTLAKIPIGGGAPVTLCTVASGLYGASWSNGKIVFGVRAAGHNDIEAVADAGGTPQVLATVPVGFPVQPQLVDHGRKLLFAIYVSGSPAQIVIQDLGNPGSRRTLVSAGSDPHLLPGGDLVYIDNGTLFGVPVSLSRGAATGTPVPLLTGVAEQGPVITGQYAISANGTLAYWPGSVSGANVVAPSVLAWVDRQGHETPLAAPARAYQYPRVSPDGTKVAVNLFDESHDIWLWDVSHQTLSRVTSGDAASHSASGYTFATWMPDGRRLVYGLDGANSSAAAIYRRAADGSGGAEELLPAGMGGLPLGVSQDGKWLLFRQLNDLRVLAFAQGVPSELFSAPGSPNAAISPDGRWIAYESNETGRYEIYVRPFPAVGNGRWQVSPTQGAQPVWARNGRELYYVDASGLTDWPQSHMMAVATPPAATFTYSTAQPLFSVADYTGGPVGTDYDVGPDGRFLMVKPVASRTAGATVAEVDRLVVVTNWFSVLRERMK